MPKKTTRTAKTSQRTKEEQWRRRMGAQGRSLVEDAGSVDESAEFDGEQESSVQVIAPARTSTYVQPRSTVGTAAGRASTASSVSQRRASSTAAARASRLRPAATGLSMDEEMYYVRSDIKRLVILTGICLAVLIVLSFLIR